MEERVYNLEVEDYHTYFVGSGGVLVHNMCEKAKSGGKVEGDGNPRQNTGRGRNNIMPDPEAQGSHSVFKRDPNTGEITNYKTYEPNPQNPSGFDEVIGYDGVGKPHTNKVTNEVLMRTYVGFMKIMCILDFMT